MYLKTPVFTGSAAALVTPYDEKGIDYALLSRVVERQIEGGTAALVICATTGEAPVLTDAERTLLIGYCVRQAAGRVKIVAGVGGNNTEKAAEAAREAEILGADAVMLTAPYYNKATDEGLYRHFTRVADSTALPLIVYNVPGRTAIGCRAELYARLAEHPRISGIKEASGDISLVSRTMRLCGDEMNVWSGNDDQTLPIMALGGKGVISVAANVTPDGMAELCSICLAGDYPRARQLHERLSPLFDALFAQVNPVPVKTALELLGLDHGVYRLPLCPPAEEYRAQLESCLRALSLIP